jgi:2-dehydropantoate 2-reductase
MNPDSPVTLPRIAVVGAGSIGLYYGGRLALAGHRVAFLARGNADALRRGGLRLVEGEERDILPAVSVHTRADEIGPVDLVLITLKTTANPLLPELLPPLLHGDTRVVTLQNGLGNEERLAPLVSDDRILGGLCFIATNRTAPNEVMCYHRGHITIGELRRPAGEAARAVAGLFAGAGVPCHPVDNLLEARWRKLVWNVPFNGLSIAAGGVATDRLCADPALVREIRALMDEIRAAARALDFDIPEAFAREQFDVTPPMGAYRPSSLVDFLAGRPVEVEAIWGEPLRAAAAAGVATPRLALLYALLRSLSRA